MLLGWASLGCGSDAVTPIEVERPALSFTDWTEQTELFVELPALVVGSESPCAAHLTRLSDFAPLEEGRVTAVLRAADGSEERFEVSEVLRAGIFRPVILPRSAGVHQLRFEVHAEGIEVVHSLGEVEVYPTVAASIEALGGEAEAPSGRIVFLKEQQWVMPFGTEHATARALRPSMSVFGVIEARPEGDVIVRSPAAGRVLADGFPRLGDEVVMDAVLAGLAPRLEATDRASLDLARSAARMDLALAERERQRLEGLRVEGAVPERRVAEAMHAEDEARAALSAASRRGAIFDRALRTGGSRSGALPIRAPITGSVIAIEVGPGASVEEGDPLFRIVAPGSAWLALSVPEGDVARLGAELSAAFTLPGRDGDRVLAPSTLVSRSLVVDPDTRAATVRFAIDDASVPLGAHVEARLFLEGEVEQVAIPWAAVLDDAGMSVAFVQVEGEAFERRVLRLGIRDGDWVGVLSGIALDEHVVTTGAIAIRLAGASGTIPAHGHSH